MFKKMKLLCVPFVFAAVCLIIPNPAFSKTYNLKLSSPFPPGEQANMGCDDFAALVEKKTNGEVKIKTFLGNLGSAKDAWDMVKNNTVQFTWTGDLYNPGRMPVSDTVQMPFEVPNVTSAYYILRAIKDAGYLDKEYTGMKALYLLPTYPIGIYMVKKKINRLEDLRGMKIRSGTGLQGQALIKLGASTVSLPGSEEYMALQTNVIDATGTGINIAVHRKLNEVTKYALKEPALFFGVFVMLMNEKTWDKLPPSAQQAISEASNEIPVEQVRLYSSSEEKMWADYSQKAEVYSLSVEEQQRWRATLGTLSDDYAVKMNEKGYQMVEALTLMRRILGR